MLYILHKSEIIWRRAFRKKHKAVKGVYLYTVMCFVVIEVYFSVSSKHYIFYTIDVYTAYVKKVLQRMHIILATTFIL